MELNSTRREKCEFIFFLLVSASIVIYYTFLLIPSSHCSLINVVTDDLDAISHLKCRVFCPHLLPHISPFFLWDRCVVPLMVTFNFIVVSPILKHWCSKFMNIKRAGKSTQYFCTVFGRNSTLPWIYPKKFRTKAIRRYAILVRR